MSDVLSQIDAFYRSWKPGGAPVIHSLKQAGSNRQYFRVNDGGNSYILTYNPGNVPENNAFIEFSRHFHTKQLPVPEILHVDEAKTRYIQSDFGDVSLFHIMQKEGFTPHVKDLFKKSLRQLARLQIEGGQHLDYTNCIATRSFDKQAIYSDLLYFLYYFVRALDLPYDKNQLMNDFDLLSSYLMQEEQKYFMHRDCQSRNIMVSDERVYFIDYQGGMQGALQYDVASMLWQARASLPYEWRDELLQYYFDEANGLLGQYFFQIGDYDQAIRHLEREIDGKAFDRASTIDRESHYLLALIYTDHRPDARKATEHASAYYELHPDAQKIHALRRRAFRLSESAAPATPVAAPAKAAPAEDAPSAHPEPGAHPAPAAAPAAEHAPAPAAHAPAPAAHETAPAGHH